MKRSILCGFFDWYEESFPILVPTPGTDPNNGNCFTAGEKLPEYRDSPMEFAREGDQPGENRHKISFDAKAEEEDILRACKDSLWNPVR